MSFDSQKTWEDLVACSSIYSSKKGSHKWNYSGNFCINHLLDNIFQIMDAENVTVTQIIPCLAMVSEKMKVILPRLSKNSIILWEKISIILKNSEWHWNVTSRFHRGRERGKACWTCGCFSWTYFELDFWSVVTLKKSWVVFVV